MRDPAGPEQLYPVFDAVLAELIQSGGIGSFRQSDGHVLIALGGTETFRSYKLHPDQQFSIWIYGRFSWVFSRIGSVALVGKRSRGGRGGGLVKASVSSNSSQLANISYSVIVAMRLKKRGAIQHCGD
jgi:hypothetical protein